MNNSTELQQEIQVEEKEIGIVSINYNSNTKKLYTHFSPAIEVKMQCEIEIKGDAINQVMPQAKQAVSNWFNKVTEIELHDAFESEIAFEILKKRNFINGKLKTLILRVYLKPISHAVI